MRSSSAILHDRWSHEELDPSASLRASAHSGTACFTRPVFSRNRDRGPETVADEADRRFGLEWTAAARAGGMALYIAFRRYTWRPAGIALHSNNRTFCCRLGKPCRQCLHTGGCRYSYELRPGRAYLRTPPGAVPWISFAPQQGRPRKTSHDGQWMPARPDV